MNGDATLEQFLTGVAAEAGADPPRRTPSTVEFERDGRLFAALSGNVAEIRLQTEIAEAALGTPSTSPSTRGLDWVRLAVDEPTQMDLDRAKAWFLSAWRNAAD